MVRKMSIETTENKAENQDKKVPENRREEMSGDECERKEQDPPLEIGEHYLVKRGEDSWRTYIASSTFPLHTVADYVELLCHRSCRNHPEEVQQGHRSL